MFFTAHHHWPDALDLATTCLFLVGFVALTISGHVFLALDVRTWLRSLRRALIVVTEHLPQFPRWSRLQTPRCLASMGLKLPCNEQQLMANYRKKVKQLHPDRGGDRKRFMRLQADFEESLEFIRSNLRCE
jgi:hypothetical protein